MKLYDFGLGIFVFLILLAGLSIGRSTCACGDLPQSDETIKQIKSPTI